MVDTQKNDYSRPTALKDKTENLKKEFQTETQNSEEERRSFLKKTRSVGIVSRSGQWLVQNASAGEIAEAPGADNRSVSTQEGGVCLCPQCYCSDDPTDADDAKKHSTWDKKKNENITDTRTDHKFVSQMAQPKGAFIPI